MKNKYIYIGDPKWFESTALRNPIVFSDHKMHLLYPEWYQTVYDLKLLVTNAPTEAEKRASIYNNDREMYGSTDIEVLRDAALQKRAKHVFLNGFKQEHLDYIVPFIQEDVELLYLFKCNSITDLSVLSKCKKLRCLLVFWNNKLEKLWDMEENKELKVISLDAVTKIREIQSLKNSTVAYFASDSSDNSGNRKDLLIEDMKIFDEMPNLKHLKLVYKKCFIDY